MRLALPLPLLVDHVSHNARTPSDELVNNCHTSCNRAWATQSGLNTWLSLISRFLSVIQEHRYPEKNTALVQISFKLGLRVQEIALLQIKDVAELGPESSGSGQRSFKLKEILALPAA